MVLAPTAAAARRRTFLRPAAAAGFVWLAFDPHNGQDEYGSHPLLWSAIRPPRCRTRGKFNDGAHIKLSSDCRTDTIWPAMRGH
jgi:hypothetical protein